MRAIDFVIFLTCLNAGFYIVDAIGVFGSAAIGGRILSVQIEIAGVRVSGVAIVGAMAAAVLAASVTVLGTRVTQPIGVAVAAFSGLYIFLLADAMAILSEIKMGGIGIPPAILLAMGTFNVLIFLIAMIQMVSGGMRTAR